jgi:hypothetical protein
MAHLIPSSVSDITNDAERYLAETLRDALPQKWVVIHGQRFVTKTDDRVHIGETDFLIINPEQGMLVMETKSGNLHYDPAGEYWYHIDYNGNKRKLSSRNPLEQVTDNMYKLKNIIEARYPKVFSDAKLGYAIALPSSRYEGELPPALTPDLVLTEFDCRPLNIRRAVERAFRFFAMGSTFLNDSWMQQILNCVSPTYQITPLQHRIHEDYDRRLHRLTNDQINILDQMKSFPMLAFRGGAGTGKTMLAMAKAQQEAAEGRRVLFLCYNSALKVWLEDTYETQGSAGVLKIDNFHGLVQELAAANNIKFTPNTDDFWREGSANILFEIAVDKLTGTRDKEKYDSIIIDEGQDFHPSWWDAIEQMFREQQSDPHWFIFYDPKQNVHAAQQTLPAKIPIHHIQLTLNCRNTVKISEHVAELIHIDAKCHQDLPMGNPPQFIKEREVGIAVESAIKQALKLVNDGLEPKNVCILHHGVFANQQVRMLNTKGFTDDVRAWRKNKGILVCSVRRFKGLEAGSVIIIEDRVNDPSDEGTETVNTLRYVARSRAKIQLTVYQTPHARGG